MAKQLSPEEVDFRRTRGDSSWFDRQWLDGNPWLLVSGEDFTSKPETARARLANEAAAANLGYRSKLLGNGDIVFQTYVRTEEQIAMSKAAAAKRTASRKANAKKAAAKPA